MKRRNSTLELLRIQYRKENDEYVALVEHAPERERPSPGRTR